MARIDAYAYYLSTYSNNRSTRYDTHKKSDLRKIYNNMVKVNKESPLYRLKNEDAVTKFAIDIKENAKNIQNVVASLSDNYGDFSDSFRKKVAVSSNESSVEVKYIGDGSEIDDMEAFDIQVKRLSAPQVNMGNYMPNDVLSFTPGSYSFDLSTNRSTYEFQFTVKESETNQNVLRKLANLINRSTLGVNATIKNGTEEEGGLGNSALTLTSSKTGNTPDDGPVFEVSAAKDAASMKAMNLLGIQNITKNAHNSIFTINGEEFSSMTNNFTINDTFELNLNAVSAEDDSIHISFKPDVDAVADNISTLVDAFNGILSIAQNTSQKATGDTNKLLMEISGLSKARRESLGKIGLSVDEKGSISINKDVLAEAITPERAEETFAKLSRFKSALGAKADNVSINPMNYVNKKVVAYKNPGKTWPAPYFSSVYSGMMLDRYV